MASQRNTKSLVKAIKVTMSYPATPAPSAPLPLLQRKVTPPSQVAGATPKTPVTGGSDATPTTRLVRDMVASVAQVAGLKPDATEEERRKASERVLTGYNKAFFG